MKLSKILGLKIIELRYTSKYRNKHGLSEFHSYLKLSNKKIVEIPIYPDEDLLEVSEIKFFFAKRVKLNREKIENQIINNFYFMFIKDELYEGQKAFLELGNGYFLTETNYLPEGLFPDINIRTEKEFYNYKKEEELDLGVKLKPYLIKPQT